MKVYFWHDFTSQSHPQRCVNENFHSVRGTYDRAFQSWETLRNIERVVIVICNTQNNLSRDLGDAYIELGFDFNKRKLMNLKEALELSLGRQCEFLCITYNDLGFEEIKNLAAQDITVVKIPEDTSEWKGSNEIWGFVFQQYFASQDLKSRLQHVRKRRAKLSVEVKKYQKKVARIEASKSWRFTCSLRRILTFFRLTCPPKLPPL